MVSSAGCVFCTGSCASCLPDTETFIVWRHPEGRAIAILNALPLHQRTF